MESNGPSSPLAGHSTCSRGAHHLRRDGGTVRVDREAGDAPLRGHTAGAHAAPRQLGQGCTDQPPRSAASARAPASTSSTTLSVVRITELAYQAIFGAAGVGFASSHGIDGRKAPRDAPTVRSSVPLANDVVESLFLAGESPVPRGQTPKRTNSSRPSRSRAASLAGRRTQRTTAPSRSWRRTRPLGDGLDERVRFYSSGR